MSTSGLQQGSTLLLFLANRLRYWSKSVSQSFASDRGVSLVGCHCHSPFSLGDETSRVRRGLDGLLDRLCQVNDAVLCFCIFGGSDILRDLCLY